MSPSATVVLLRLGRIDRISGVVIVDLLPRVGFLIGGPGLVGRMAGDCRLREGCEGSSPFPGEAVRLRVVGGCTDVGLLGPIHGLVKGEISKSKSEERLWKAMLAGAELDPCGMWWY